jgi:predicted RNase H-like HicB family nuclease
VEKTETGCSAYSPDLPGCVATGRFPSELERTMREAILFHLDGLREDQEPIPDPHSYCTVCEV